MRSDEPLSDSHTIADGGMEWKPQWTVQKPAVCGEEEVKPLSLTDPSRVRHLARLWGESWTVEKVSSEFTFQFPNFYHQSFSPKKIESSELVLNDMNLI